MITKKVVLLGKTNVGKSSIYNVLTKGSRALVSPVEHVTRDALIAPLRFSKDYNPSTLGFCVEMVDLAGFDFQKENFINFNRPHTDFYQSLKQHVYRIVNRADLILALFDLKNITTIDREMIAWIKKRNVVKKKIVGDSQNLRQKIQPVLYVFNKVDNEKEFSFISEAYELGVKDLFFVSAKSKRGLNELTRAICSTLCQEKEKIDEQKLDVMVEKTAETGTKIDETDIKTAETGIKTAETGIKIDETDTKTAETDIKIDETDIKTAETGIKIAETGIKIAETGIKDSLAAVKNENFTQKGDFSQREDEVQEQSFSISIIGKPNAGKSSLLNILLNENRALVSDMPGTTRDSIVCDIRWQGISFTLFDTAGMRRKSQKKDKIEEFSVKQSIKSIKNSALSLLLVDATLPISEQDKKISAVAFHNNKALMVIFNKWDLVEQNWKDFVDRQLFLFPLLKNFILLPLSTKTRYHVSLLKKKILFFEQLAKKKHSTAMINRVLQEALKKTSPPTARVCVSKNIRNPKKSKCKYLVFKPLYATRISSLPFVVKIFCHHVQALKPAYESYLKRHFRDAFFLTGFPIHLIFEEINRDREASNNAK